MFLGYLGVTIGSNMRDLAYYMSPVIVVAVAYIWGETSRSSIMNLIRKKKDLDDSNLGEENSEIE